MNLQFSMTRQAGLDRLAACSENLGRAYASGRNIDPGPDGEATTSMLSPYLRRRLVLEQEAVAAALAMHGPAAAEKFIQEVFWRTYFKGFLESRPAIWANYLSLAEAGQARLETNDDLRRRFDDAVAGRTGIACFDDWARALVADGWLHNHTRMWFASIWIFTLDLPWALGAEFFLQNLIDGDPASNTLSWRWVAGLHTRGKCYAARAENISRFTGGRYAPTGLNETPVALEEDDFPEAPKSSLAAMPPRGEVALLLHLDDLHPESLDFQGMKIVRIAGMLAHADRAAGPVRQADAGALADGMRRAAAFFECEAGPAALGWNLSRPIVTAWAPVGPTAAALPPSHRIRRRWDSLVWPHATRGFFKVRAAIPAILAEITPNG